MEVSRAKRKKKKKRIPRWVSITLSSILVLLIGTGAYAYHVYHDVASAVKKMNVPLAGKKAPKVNFNNGDPISILMLGVDERPDDGGRSDSILVITVNPKTKTTKLLSIPRDTRTMLINKKNPSKNKIDKINAAYAYGGVQESIDTVENLINVPIDYYIKINMKGFQDLVDAVGGIDVNNKYAFELDGVSLKTGPQHLDGIQALEYARMRHQDPMGDFGREQRQREVISKIIQKGKSISVLTKYNAVLNALEKNIQTNLTLDDIIGIQSSYKAAAKNIDSFQLTGTNDTINGTYYYKIDDQERQSISDQLRKSLGLSSSSVSKIYDYAATDSSTSTQKSSTSSSSSTSGTSTRSSSTSTTVKSATTSQSSVTRSSSSTSTSTATKPSTSTGASTSTGSSSSTSTNTATGSGSTSTGTQTGSGSSSGSGSGSGSGSSSDSSSGSSTNTGTPPDSSTGSGTETTTPPSTQNAPS